MGSCDLMDNALKSPPVYEFAGQELNPRNHVKKVPWPAPGKAVLWPLGHPRNGTQKCTNVTTVVDSATETVFDETLNATVPKKENLTTCELEWEQGFDTEKLPPKEYDLNMWVRKCPKGVRAVSEPRATGRRSDQCSEGAQAHGTPMGQLVVGSCSESKQSRGDQRLTWKCTCATARGTSATKEQSLVQQTPICSDWAASSRQ